MSSKSMMKLKNQSKFSQQNVMSMTEEAHEEPVKLKSSNETYDLNEPLSGGMTYGIGVGQSSKSANLKPKCLIVNDNPIALMQAKFLIQPFCCAILEA